MKRKLSKSQILRLIDNRKDGFTNQEIAKQLGVHPETINYWFKRLRDSGYEIPPKINRGGRNKLDL